MPFSFQILYEAVCFYPIVSNNYIPNICCMWTISKLPSCLVCICIVHVSVAKRGTCNGHGRWWIKQVIVFWSWISIFHVCQSRLFQCFIPNTPLSLPISISFNHVFLNSALSLSGIFFHDPHFFVVFVHHQVLVVSGATWSWPPRRAPPGICWKKRFAFQVMRCSWRRTPLLDGGGRLFWWCLSYRYLVL